MPLDYFFFGTASICLEALEQLQAAGLPPRAVVCQPDRPAGRGRKLQAPPVKLWASARGIDVFQPLRCSEPSFLEAFSAHRPAIGLVFAYGQILPAALLSRPRLGFINIHPSLLPRWRGAAPVQWAILAGDSHTGVSIVRVTPRLDDGEILLQQQVEIEPEEDAAQLGKRLAVMGGQMAARALSSLENETLVGTRQDESRATWARALEKSDGLIDWNRSATELHRQVRGLQPWPVAWTRWRGRALKIHSASCRPGTTRGRPGEILQASGDTLLVATGRDALSLVEVQQEGRRRLPVREFLLGNRLQPGERLG